MTADEAYGGDSQFRRLLEDRGVGFVVAVSKAQRLWAPGFRQLKAEDYVREFAGDSDGESTATRRGRSSPAGPGRRASGGTRWAAIRFGAALLEQDDGRVFRKALLVRESLSESETGVRERAYYLTCSPEGTTLQKAGGRSPVRGGRSRSVSSRPKQETGWTNTK